VQREGVGTEVTIWNAESAILATSMTRSTEEVE